MAGSFHIRVSIISLLAWLNDSLNYGVRHVAGSGTSQKLVYANKWGNVEARPKCTGRPLLAISRSFSLSLSLSDDFGLVFSTPAWPRLCVSNCVKVQTICMRVRCAC